MIFRVGDEVRLKDVSQQGKITEYLGFHIAPKYRGRMYRIAFTGKKSTVCFDFELIFISRGTRELNIK